MAKVNLFETLRKEMEKGNDIVIKDGTVIAEETHVKNLKKEYLDKVKNEEIDMLKMSFAEYVLDEKATEVNEILAILEMILAEKYDDLIEYVNLLKEENKESEEE